MSVLLNMIAVVGKKCIYMNMQLYSSQRIDSTHTQKIVQYRILKSLDARIGHGYVMTLIKFIPMDI
jgi:hypothetical protein